MVDEVMVSQGEAGPPLLATKLRAPSPRRGLVDRSRLTDRLDPGRLPSLTLVSAPAGFGKTTLLADWLSAGAGDGCRTAWLSLDERDDDPASFWAYVAAAVRGTGASDARRAAAPPTTPEPSDTVVASLLDELAAVGGEVVLVIDDYHVISSTDVHEAVAYLVEHLPAHVHLVIAGRTDPPLPLARLRARGELLEIRAGDLRFTADEAADYLNESMGLALTPADVGSLEARTEGWIAALQLAALSMQGRDDPTGFIATFAGDDRFIVDFLVEEVLDRQTEEVRSFLLATSILDRFTGEACDAVTGGVDGGAVLERLERANLFLVPLDDRRAWYRYHQLFADVLRARLLAERPDLVADLHRRASRWYEAEGDAAEAIGHAMAAGDVEGAARLIELAAPGQRRLRREATLRRWLEALPDETYVGRPVLAMNLVGARLATGDPSGVEALLELVEAALDPSSGPPVVFQHDDLARLPAQIHVHRAGVALLAGDIGTAMPLAARVLEVVEPGDHFLRGVGNALLGLGHWAGGDLREAERRYVEAVSAFAASDHLPDMLGCSLALADIQIALGELGAATRTFESGLRCTAEHPGLRGAADMHVGLSEVLIERNDLDAAARHLESSADLGAQAGLPQHAYRWRVTTARLCRARGELERALELLDEADPLYDTDFSPPVRPVAALRARVQLALGDLASPLEWVARRGLTVDDELDYVRELEHITLCRVLIARHATDHDRGDLDGALALLGRLLVAAEAGGRDGSAVEILVLLAVVLGASGDRPAATVALEDALRRAEPEGHVRVFLHSGPDVVSMLRALASRQEVPSHVHRVLAAVDADAVASATSTAGPRRSGARPALVDELSPREVDVLRLLRSDLSGPEIAADLFVSLNTVRTHTRRIYVKLGVRNRREAVRRADELGL